MYQLEQTGQFKKDIKLAKKRGLDMLLLDEIVTDLVETGLVDKKFKPHKLVGNYNDLWECHILSDWLLIWEQDKTIKLISLIRTGSHSDLF
ncbi:MAG: type II toxin-antitoxin system YafQ family toxin [Moheibacter sp.]